MESIRDTMLVTVALLVTMTGCSDSSGPSTDSGTRSASVTAGANLIPGEGTTPGLEAPTPADVDQAMDPASWNSIDTVNPETPVDETDGASYPEETEDYDHENLYDDEYSDGAEKEAVDESDGVIAQDSVDLTDSSSY